MRVSAGRPFFIALGALGVAGGVGLGVVATPEPSLFTVLVGVGVTIFSFSVVGGFGLGLGWVQAGPDGLSASTYRGRRLVPWHEARFVEWVLPGGPPFGGWTRPAVAVYRARSSESAPRPDERLLVVRLRFIVSRRQQVRVARQLLEVCRRFGASTRVEHRVGHGLVDEAIWKEIEK